LILFFKFHEKLEALSVRFLTKTKHETLVPALKRLRMWNGARFCGYHDYGKQLAYSLDNNNGGMQSSSPFEAI
jgi:hypothetical protein